MLRTVTTFVTMIFLSVFGYSKEAPLNIEFKSLPGDSLTATKIENFNDLKGKVVLVDFWASWCGPCNEAAPHYNKLYKKYKDQGVIFIGINEDENSKERDAFLKKHPADFALYADSSKQMAKAFKVQAIPSLFIFNKKMEAVALFRGFNEGQLKAIEKKLEDLLTEQ